MLCTGRVVAYWPCAFAAGLSIHLGAMSNAKWGGVLLRDVLMYSGLLTPQSAKNFGVHHVCFKAVDGVQASIPIEKALSPYVDFRRAAVPYSGASSVYLCAVWLCRASS